MKEMIADLINVVDNTFAKKGISNAPRKVLEELINLLYDRLNEMNDTYPDWWDRDECK